MNGFYFVTGASGGDKTAIMPDLKKILGIYCCCIRLVYLRTLIKNTILFTGILGYNVGVSSSK
jgi:hypothetical protein